MTVDMQAGEVFREALRGHIEGTCRLRLLIYHCEGDDWVDAMEFGVGFPNTPYKCPVCDQPVGLNDLRFGVGMDVPVTARTAPPAEEPAPLRTEGRVRISDLEDAQATKREASDKLAEGPGGEVDDG